MSERPMLLTEAEAAALLRLSKRLLRSWRARRLIRFVKFSGRCIRYYRADIEKLAGEYSVQGRKAA